jgi:Tol biopolymer transport system component
LRTLCPLPRLVSYGLSVFLLCAALVLPTPSAGASPSVVQPEGQSDTPIAYVVRDHHPNADDIYMVHPGGEPTPLAVPSALESQPEWSPDGTKIAFISREDTDSPSDIFVMNADGSGLMRLTNHPENETNPTWSANGRRIAFTSDRRENSSTVFIVRADGNSTRAKRVSNIAARDIAWSPRGPLLAITNYGYLGGGPRLGIRLLNLRTQQVRWVTKRSMDVWSVDWAPSGRALAFTLSRRSGNQARLIRADGSNNRPLPTSGMDGVTTWMTWSPAWGPGGRVAYAIVGNIDGDDYPYDTPSELRVVTLGQNGEDAISETLEPGLFLDDLAW